MLPVVDDLDYARGRVAELGDLFCVTFVKAVDPAEALRRLGALPSTIAPGPAVPAGHAAALPLGKWTLVVEAGGAAGGDHVLIEAASLGTEALSVLRDSHETPRFTYAVDGSTAVAFDPAYPSAELIWGSDPQLLDHLMHALDLREPGGEDDETWLDAEAKALVLAQRITGTRIPAGLAAAFSPAPPSTATPSTATPSAATPPRAAGSPAASSAGASSSTASSSTASSSTASSSAATSSAATSSAASTGGVLVSGRLEPWFVGGPRPGDLLRLGPRSAALVAAMAAAPAAAKRAVARETLLRRATELGIGDTPGLAEALDAGGPVLPESPLGARVIEWLGSAPLASFATALRGVLDPDPEVALRAVLRGSSDEERARVTGLLTASPR